MTVYDMIRAALGESVPFAKHAGVALTHVGAGEAAAALAQTATSINHVGAQHAGALFTLGETASGGAMAGAFAEQLSAIRPLVTQTTIAYRKLATGTIMAKAKLKGDPEALRATLAETGRVSFDVDVTLENQEAVEVAAMTVTWSLRKI